MKKYFLVATLSVAFISAFPYFFYAQGTKKTINEKDKATILEIFRTIEPNLYRVGFSISDKYGSKFIGRHDKIDKLVSGQDVVIENAMVETYFPTVNLWFIVTKPVSPAEGLEGVFGKQNASKLKSLLNKYTGG
ncbi:MAG TPA: hypothetical protein VF144_04470 [Chitinophagaceae bacterium]